jgi:hypothetical protein
MRAWVLVLLVANLAFFVWTQGWVSPWLPAPWQGQREPQRVVDQVNPERVAVRRTPADAAGPAAAGAASALAAAAAASASVAASGPAAAASVPRRSAR